MKVNHGKIWGYQRDGTISLKRWAKILIHQAFTRQALTRQLFDYGSRFNQYMTKCTKNEKTENTISDISPLWVHKEGHQVNCCALRLTTKLFARSNGLLLQCESL